ncbi:hypothetical protein V1264_014013 [Littorina saxatilis]|uniref:F-box domain-containing protein n=2 Tax=Littorina saxatilis TaxID=31220 RepID=A0AAN9BUR0_9CAEN
MTSRGFHNEDRLSAQSEASALRGGVMETRAWARRWSSGQPAQWQSLPPEILCRVFHHLLDKDRCAARLACSQWDQVFRMPQLWRERRFKFSGMDECEGLRAARYMATLGGHLRHLEMEIGMPVVHNARLISLSVETFLNTKPKGLRLTTFACSGLEFFQTPLYRIARHRVRMVRALCAMLRRQKWLEHVGLACSQMGREDGARLLRALSFHCRPRSGKTGLVNRCLQSLELRDFFMEDVNVVELGAFKEEMGRFSALRHVGLNFTYLNDAVLAQLTDSASRTLETLSLGLDGSHLLYIAHMTYNNLIVTTGGWRAAGLRCPRLRVVVDMRGRFRLIDFQRVLIPGMPLACLSITSLIASLFFASEDMLAHIARLVEYLADRYSYTLTTFHLSWCDPSATWPHREALVDLVRSCTSLSCLSLTMKLPLDTVTDVAAAASKHSASSEPLHLHISGVDRNVALAAMQVPATRTNCVLHTSKCTTRL